MIRKFIQTYLPFIFKLIKKAEDRKGKALYGADTYYYLYRPVDDEEHAKKIVKRAKTALSKVPVKNFIQNEFTDTKGKCCAIGHFQRILQNRTDYRVINCHDGHNEKIGLRGATKFLFDQKGLKVKQNPTQPMDITTFNNAGKINGKEQTIKQNVLEGLNLALK